MFTKKSLLIPTIILSFFSGHGMAVTCGRLEKVSAGEDHSLALADDGSLWSCGWNEYKVLGLGASVSEANSLQQVLGENGNGHLKNIVAFDAGWYHSLAADSDGICYSWGTSTHGQLGNNPPLGYWAVPHRVNGFGDLGEDTNVVYVSAGRSGKHSLIVDSNGYVYGFGYNYFGQCGDGTKVQKNVPALVLDDTNTPGVYLGDIAHIIAVDAGVNHSLALSDSNSGGYVWEWGENNNSSYPRKVPGLNGVGNLANIIGISSCAHSVAVDSSGYVYEWKDDIPYRVPGGQMRTTYLQNIAEVSAGYNYEDYSLARTNDGRVLIWNFGGEPQYVPAGDMNTPSDLLEGIVSIAAGYYDHKLAVSEDGYGWAWGIDNSYGKFGVGDVNSHLKPTKMVCDEPSKPVIFFKTDDVNEADCVEPFIHNHINYQIFYDMNGYSDSNIFIIDILPEEVNYSSSSHDGNYVPEIHTVIWGPWNLDGSDTDTLTLTVEVTDRAEPGSTITNIVKIFGDSVYERDTEDAEICCYLGNKIYVDADAPDGGNGASWQTAFNDLQYALDFVTINQCYDTIYVAKGTYKTTEDANLTDADFALRNNIGLFGHFAGTEKSPYERVLDNTAYETILKDEIKNSYAADNVVTADGITGAVLDGFTVTGAYEDDDCGINIDNDANISIANCKIRNNYYGLGIDHNSCADIHNCTIFSDNSSSKTGIKAQNSTLSISDSYFTGHTNYSIDASSTNLTVIDSNFIESVYYSAISSFGGQAKITGCTMNNKGSVGYGISCDGDITITDCKMQNAYYGLYFSSGNLVVKDRCKIFGNSWAGICAAGGTVRIECSFIYNNTGNEGGIYVSGTQTAEIFNNWIFGNYNGIQLGSNSTAPKIRNNTIADNTYYGIYSWGTPSPEIKNCIIWNPGADDLDGCSATYSCIYDSSVAGGTGNISGDANDPQFYNSSIDDYHLTEVSLCIDKGDGTYNETDIDGEDRVMDGDGDGEPKIDMGADEFYHPKADYNRDEIVNFIDYSEFANNWLDVNEDISLDTDPNVNIYDLALFCKDWLWYAPWGSGFSLPCIAGGGGEMSLSESVSPQLYVGGYYPGGLMLSDISESLDAMPDSLYSKVERFYMSPTVSPQASLGVLSPHLSAASIDELLEWLDGLWEEGEIQEHLTYEQYIEFREAIKESIPLY